MLIEFVERGRRGKEGLDRQIERNLKVLRAQHEALMAVGGRFMPSSVRLAEIFLVRAGVVTGSGTLRRSFLVLSGGGENQEYQWAVGMNELNCVSWRQEFLEVETGTNSLKVALPVVDEVIVSRASLLDKLSGRGDRIRANLQGLTTPITVSRVLPTRHDEQASVMATWRGEGEVKLGGVGGYFPVVVEVADTYPHATVLTLAELGLTALEVYRGRDSQKAIRGVPFFGDEHTAGLAAAAMVQEEAIRIFQDHGVWPGDSRAVSL